VTAAAGVARQPGPTVSLTSFAQEQLWVLNHLEGGGEAYHTAITLRLTGQLDVAALRQALASLTEQHPALRTGFAELKGHPVQLVRPGSELPLAFIDLAGLADADAESEARALLQADARTPFDLAKPPLARCRLVRLAAGRHLLGLCVHHIVFDGWSTQILIRDLAALYTGIVSGSPARLPVPLADYGDYATRQRQRMTGRHLADAERFWREYLAGAPELLELPADRPRPPQQSFAGGRVFGRVERATADALGALARAQGSTLFVALLAGLATVLARRCGQQDLVVATPVAQRGEPEFEDVIGLFVNTVVMRADLSGRPSFRELITRLAASTTAALSHGDLPFEKLVEAVSPRRSAAYQPVFQVMLILQNKMAESLRLPGVTATAAEPADTGASQFDLTLSVHQFDAGLWLDLTYNTDIFERATAARLLGHVAALLAAAAERPDAPVWTLPMVPPDESAHLLTRLSGRAAAGPGAGAGAGRLVPELFAATAARTPDAVAVTCDGEQVSYAELDRSAEALAGRLRQAGVGTDVLVGLALPRGIGFVTGMLAIWKAGGAVLPLDPAQPERRQLDILGRAAPRVVLAGAGTRESLAAVAGQLPAARRPRLLLADRAAPPAAPAAPAAPAGPARPRPGRHPDSAAYVLFTSGTTGVPKGAVISHRGMAGHMAGKIADLGLGPADVLAQNGPATFDVVVWQCIAPLLAGGRVHVIPAGAVADPDRLADEAGRGGVTILQVVPSAIALLLASEAAAAGLAGLRWLVPTGDAMPADLARRWLARHPGIPLLNTYGTTECSDDQCHAAIGAAPGQDAGPVAAIGAPLPGVTAYVLDPELGLAPVGVPGELYLGGACVGRGYLGQPGLTAGRFVPDPFAASGDRFYRTGDTVRWLASGQLEFLGRADDQVKVRGFRVEPAEVAAALAEHPGVAEAVVAATGTAGPDRRLVGYLVPAGQPVPAADLRAFAARSLPDYMLPDQFVWLDRLPVTRHGKVDRSALPEPAAAPAAPASPAGQQPPGTATEEVLAAIWSGLLELPQLAAQDNFFDLGGNSLLAVQSLLRVRAAFGVRLGLGELFDNPTVPGLARAIDAARREHGAADVLTAIPARPRATGAAPASFAQERLWVVDQLAGFVPGLYTVPMAFRLLRPVPDDVLRAALAGLLRRHEALRTGLGTDPRGRVVQEVTADAAAPLSITDLTGVSGLPADDQDRQVLALLDATAGQAFRLGQPPLIRAHAVRVAADNIVMGVFVHHAMTDAWSNRLLVRDLLELITAGVERRPPDLPAVAVQYQDFAAWQRATLTDARRAALLGHWARRLAGAPAQSTLPPDRPRPVAASYRGGRQSIAVPQQLPEDLQRLARDHDVTLFMVLLAAVAVVLYRCSGQSDLVIGTPVSGRLHPDLRESVGMFVNTLVLRLDLSGGPGFAELLRRVRQECLAAYDHAELPFEALVDGLKPPRTMAYNPIYQVVVSLQNLPARTEGPAWLASFPLPDPGTAKFDLDVQFAQSAGALAGFVEYAADLYLPGTAQDFGRALLSVLGAAAADPGAGVDDLPMPPASPREPGAGQAGQASQAGPAGPAAPLAAAPLAGGSRPEVERVLAGLWREVLGVERVGPGDNFFELGGNSVLGLLLVSHARRAGLQLAASDFFEHQTLGELAAVAESIERPQPQAPGAPADPRFPVTPVDDATLNAVLAQLPAQEPATGDHRG
jgi:amino acid adenylation domain-containing protein